jgi:hypothetical protein
MPSWRHSDTRWTLRAQRSADRPCLTVQRRISRSSPAFPWTGFPFAHGKLAEAWHLD